jgi:hypothetical protein
MPVRELAAFLGVAPMTAQKLLVEGGIERRKKGRPRRLVA